MLLLYAAVLVVCAATSPKNESQPSRNAFLTVQTILAEGYHAETHHTVTKDGYVLELHRIPYGKNGNAGAENRPVVLLMHGLLGASNSYTLYGPEYSMGFNLADAGYDAWMGNARGTKNSRRHTTLDPDSPIDKFQFFNFTYEEIGLDDVPTMVDYILNHTRQERLHYIGHSQGGTVFLVLNSMRPEYNRKFASAHLLAGVGYQNHFPHSQLLKLARFTDVIYPLAVSLGYVELYPPNSTVAINTNNNSSFCAGFTYFQNICEKIPLTSDDIDMNLIGGASLKQVAHYGQNIRDKAFRRWHFGTAKNLQVYGTETPPKYDIGKVTVKTTMHYTPNDLVLDERDVLAMANDMPNADVRRVKRDSFGHEEFVTAKDARELVTEHIIEALAQAHPIEESEESIEVGTEDMEEEEEPNAATTDKLKNRFEQYCGCRSRSEVHRTQLMDPVHSSSFKTGNAVKFRLEDTFGGRPPYVPVVPSIVNLTPLATVTPPAG
ncbi:unnamed protein product, partial [Iphiclides podalirius]